MILKVLSFTASKPATKLSSLMPSVSRAPQRFSEAMQSSDVTGLPSCHLRPSRSVKV